MNKLAIWLPPLFIAFVFLQSLIFKFASWFGEPADVTVYIFSTIGDWMNDIGLAPLGDLFASYGGVVVGLTELIAAILVLITATRFYGALIALAVMSGAIFFHVFTPLGLFPYTDLSCLESGCPREYPLFFMAVITWCCALYLVATKGGKKASSKSG